VKSLFSILVYSVCFTRKADVYMVIDGNKVSARDVAAQAGVSPPVVSWVANGTATQHRISESTQRRVRGAIEQMGYEPAKPAGPAVVGCPVDKLLSGRPADSLSSTTKQPDNLTTLLSSSGYRLVPVQTKADLAAATDVGLVGLVYRESRVASSELRVGSGAPVVTAVPAVVSSADHPGYNAADTAVTTEEARSGAPVVTAVPAVVVSEVQPGTNAADTAATTEEVRSEAPVVTAVPAVVNSNDPPGANATGMSAGVPEEETPVSILVAEPELPAPPPSTTQQPNNLTTAPQAPSPSTTEQPDNPTTEPQAPSASEVAADVSASSTPAEMSAVEAVGEVQPSTDAADTATTTEEIRSGAPVVTAVPAGVSSEVQPGTNAAGTSASTLTESEIEIPAPAPVVAPPIVSEVAPQIPEPVPVATVVPEMVIQPVAEPIPVVVVVSEVAAEPIPPPVVTPVPVVSEEGPAQVPEPVVDPAPAVPEVVDASSQESAEESEKVTA